MTDEQDNLCVHEKVQLQLYEVEGDKKLKITKLMRAMSIAVHMSDKIGTCS